MQDLTPDQQDEVLAVANNVPRVSMDIKVGMKGRKDKVRTDKDIVAGKDFVTVGITMTREYGDESLEVRGWVSERVVGGGVGGGG